GSVASLSLFVLFFFSSRRRHTSFSRDWSSDVCSSDLTAAVAALPDEAEICGCNGVCKGKITGAITEKGLTTLEAVRAHTKASARSEERRVGKECRSRGSPLP